MPYQSGNKQFPITNATVDKTKHIIILLQWKYNNGYHTNTI